MGFLSDLGKGWATYVAPAAGAIAGGAIGGPMGAAAGGTLGSIPGSIIAQKEAEKKAREANEANYNQQKEFAQHGIRWKVEDAKRAGIHPLVGLGASTTSFSPSTVGEPSLSPPDVSAMGQNIGRAMQATRTQEERAMTDLQLQSARLDIEGKALDNQIKNSELRRMNTTGPSFPGSQNFISGQGNSGPQITEKNMERTKSLAGNPHSEPGAVPDVGYVVTNSGAVVPVPSKDAKERIEDNMPQELSHFWRNNIIPNFGKGKKPPLSTLPPGYDRWEWEYSTQGYIPVKNERTTVDGVRKQYPHYYRNKR